MHTQVGFWILECWSLNKREWKMHVYVLRLHYMLDTTLFCISIISQKITYSLEFIFSNARVCDWYIFDNVGNLSKEEPFGSPLGSKNYRQPHSQHQLLGNIGTFTLDGLSSLFSCPIAFSQEMYSFILAAQDGPVDSVFFFLVNYWSCIDRKNFSLIQVSFTQNLAVCQY